MPKRTSKKTRTGSLSQAQKIRILEERLRDLATRYADLSARASAMYQQQLANREERHA